MSDLNEVLEAHKQAIVLTGKLSEMHLKNLKTWPVLLFGNKLDTATLSYDFTTPYSVAVDYEKDGYKEKKEVKYEHNGDVEKEKTEKITPGTVVYDFKFKKNTPANFEEQVGKLKSYVKTLFWNDTEIKILINGKIWERKKQKKQSKKQKNLK